MRDHESGSGGDVTSPIDDESARVELERTSRSLRMLCRANQALVRGANDAALLGEICRIVVEIGGYRAASAGITEGPPPWMSVRRVAWSGAASAELTAAAREPDAETDDAIAAALRSAEPVIARASITEGASGPDLARRALSTLVLPLVAENQRLGVLTVRSPTFERDEISVLSELATDVAFGISALRLRAERDHATEEMRATERQLRTLIDGVPNFISRFDASGRFTYVSASVTRTTGAPREQILGRSPLEIGVSPDPETNRRLQESLERVIAGGPVERLEVTFGTLAGPRTFEVRHIPERDESGRVIGVLGVATDLEEVRAAERRAYLLDYAIDCVADGIFLLEGESPNFTHVNRSAAELLGYERDELTGGMSVMDIDPAWTPERWSEFVPVIRERKQLTIETLHRRKDGRLVPVEITGNWFEYDGREYNLAIARNVSERRAAELALTKSEVSYRTLVENSPDLIVRWNRALDRVLVNPAFAAVLRRPVEALLGRPFSDGHMPEAAAGLAQAQAAIRRVFTSGIGEIVEHSLPTPDGARVIQLRLIPERDDTGAVATVLGMGRDITPLKETERQIRTLTEHSPDVILRFDAEGRYLYANSAFERVTGTPASAHVGQLLGTVTARGEPAIYEELRRRIASVFRDGTPQEFETRVVVAAGERDFNVRLMPETDDDGSVATVLAVVRDVTAQKQAEAALRASEQRFRQVTENIDEVFWLTDAAKTEMIYVSPAYDRVFGRPSASLERDPRAWIELIHPEDRPRVTAAIARQAQGGYDLEYRIVREDGVRWIHDRAFPISDERGQVYRIAGVAEDVTIRRELEEQLRHAQKMEAVGRLAGGIAHDFNNMLAIVHMQCTLLLIEAPPKLREGIEEAIAATERAANLTRQLLTFSRRQPSQPVDLDIGHAIANMTRLFRRVLGEDIALETRFATALPFVHADPSMIEQVLMNLAINARDAMPRGGRLTISLDRGRPSPDRASARPSPEPTHVCLTVTDTGSGIDADTLPRIFEPFFTTKEVGRGTGLGLATVFGIVEQHRGSIEVESTVGEGTSFRVFLPAIAAASPSVESAPNAQSVVGGTETILLVEDEAAVRSLVRSALHRYGYSVVEADSAAAALALWEREGRAVQLLVTDLIMPGMTGRLLADRLRAVRPDLRVLYITGYSPDIVAQTLKLEEPRALLQKPFGIAELARAVRRALDAG